MTSRIEGSGIETPLLNGKAPEEGKAVAWANLNGTGVIAMRGNLNIANVVDVGTGSYTFNFTNNMNATDYAISSGAGETNGADGNFIAGRSGGMSTSAWGAISFGYNGASLVDSGHFTFSIFGPMA